MSEGLRLAGSFTLSMTAAVLLVPLAIRLALRTGFMDVPAGYKGHSRATPYLGGAAVAAAVTVSVLAFGVVTSRYAVLLIWALVLLVVGTIDDRRNVNPFARLTIEIVAAAALWHYGLGWGIIGSPVADLALTVLWVVGLVNAFNLMDNMDGAASTVAGVSALGAAALALVVGDVALAVIVLACAGACAGFVPYNLSKPSRIFLGDGGSMPLGLVVAAAVMNAASGGDFGWFALFLAAPIVGLPILDTTLVVISRKRGGRPVMLGGRDHLTYRLAALLGSPRAVAVCLAGVQTVLCISAVLLSQTEALPVLLAGAAYVATACAAIALFETRVPADVSYASAVPAGELAA